MRRHVLLFFVFVSSLAFVAAIGITAGKEPYVIGSFLSVSGSQAPLGTPERDTLVMLEEKINRAGGVDGHPIRIVIEDDASEPTNAVKVAKKLIEQDRVLAIIGGSTTGTSLAVIPLAVQAKRPFISFAAGTGITSPDNPWVFRTAQTDFIMIGKILEYLRTIGIKKVAMIYDSNAFGTGGRDQLRRQAPKAGVTVVAEESFNTKDSDLTVQLVKAKNAGAQAIICWGTNPTPAILTRNRQQLGYAIPLIQSHGVANQTYLELSGEAAEGVILPAGKIFVAESLPADDPQREVLLEYASSFRARFGREADTFGGHAWDGLYILCAALKKSGPDPVKLRAAIEATKGFAGIGGVFTYSPADHDGLTTEAVVLLQVKGGEFKLFRR